MPHIDYAFPPGGQQGHDVTVVLHGDELTDVSAVRFTGEGVHGKVTAHDEDTVTLAVHIDPDAAPGPHDMRISRLTGISNRFRFFVSQIPEINATRPRPKDFVQDLPELPVLVNGWVLSSETHAFRFNAKSGQKIVCRVQSQEINPMMANAVPGWPQMVLTLFDDRDGRQLAYDDRFRFKPDPVIICDIPHDGTYRIEIRDSLFRGRENFIYRLSIGACRC